MSLPVVICAEDMASIFTQFFMTNTTVQSDIIGFSRPKHESGNDEQISFKESSNVPCWFTHRIVEGSTLK